MRKHIALFIVLLCFQFIYTYGQESDCNKTKVGVYFIELGDLVINHLNTKYGEQSTQAWLDDIDARVIEVLQVNSPEIDFFSARNGKTSDPDYTFRYTLHLTAIDGEILVHADSVVYIQDFTGYEMTEYTDTEYEQETAFWMSSSLVVNSPCVPCLQWLIDINLSSDLELQGVIQKQSQKFWRLTNIIEAHENKRLAPAREPEMEISYDKPFISLLDEKSREMKVTVKVKNCKGQYVFYKGHSQPVYFEDELDRFKLESYKCLDPTHYKGHMVIIINKNLNANGIYKVIKGIEPLEQKISIGTCGISSQSEIYTEGKIIVKGLEIKVVPDKYQIYTDEIANIVVRFNEVNPNGNKEPISGRILDINIKGLVDGSISPKGNYNTNEKGEVHLRYKAGKKDKKIIITASYQPVNYPDVVSGSSYVNVMSNEYAWNGSFNIDVTKRFQCNVQEQASEIRHEEIRANDENTQRVNVTIGMNDFDLAVNPSIPGTRLISEASGEMHCMMNEDHFTATRAKKTECYNESGGEWEFSHIWVSPGNWSTKHETSSGQASRTIKKENINLLIVKDIELNKDAMQNLQKQMMEAAQSGDMAAVQTLKGQMVGMVQGDQNNNVIPIRIRIEILLDITKKDLITKTFERKSYNVCLKKNEEDSGSNTIEIPIAIPMGVEMKGTFTRGKDGSDIINASVDMTENTRGNFYSGKCPDATVKISGQINLERKRK